MAPKSKPPTPKAPVPKVPAPKAPTAAQLKALKESKGVKPTTAITSKGQKATGLAPSKTPDRFSMKDAGKKSGVASQKGYNAVNKVAGQAVAAAAGVATGGIVGKGTVSAVMNTYKLGKKVVHGSPTPGLKTIKPQTGSGARPNENVVFSWNPSKFRDKGEIAPMVREYSNKNGTNGSVYVGKLKRSDIIKTDPKETPPSFVVSKGPIKVTKEIKVKPQTNKSLGDEIKKSFPGRDTTKIKGKLDQRKIKKIQKPNKTLDIA